MSMLHRRAAVAPLTFVWLMCGASVAAAATFSVDSVLDAVDTIPGDGICRAADGTCTLRAAINEANALPGPDRVLVPAGHYTITIPDGGSDEDIGFIGDLDILDELELVGAGVDATVIDGNNHDRIFGVGDTSATIRGVTLEHGFGAVYAGAIFSVNSNTTVTDSAIRDCTGDQAAAAFNYQGIMRIERTTVTGGRAQSGFGALRVVEGTLVVVDSTVAGNDAGPSGLAGGIGGFDGATIEVLRSTISGNVAGRGGGVYVGGINARATLVSSTVSGNRSGNDGGGIWVGPAADATLANVTVTGNVADADGDGIGNGGGLWSVSAPSRVLVKNSIIAGNTDVAGAGADCHGGIVATGPVLIEHPDCTIGGSATGHVLGVPLASIRSPPTAVRRRRTR